MNTEFFKKNLMNVFFIIFIIFIIFVVLIFQFLIPEFRNSIVKEKKEFIKNFNLFAWDYVNTKYTQFKDGEISEEEAFRRIEHFIDTYRFGDRRDNYFWIVNSKSFLVFHPYTKDLIGQDLYNFKDSNGKYIFREFLAVVKTDREGYTEYSWQRTDKKNVYENKISYIKYFEPWDFIIGCGMYKSDIEIEVKRVIKRTNELIISLIILLLLFSVFVYLHLYSLEKERYENEIMFSTTFENTFQLMTLMDTNGIVITANNTSLSFTGKELDDVKGTFFYDDVWWEDKEKSDLVKELIQESAKGKIIRQELQIKTEDNIPRIIDISIKPVFIKDNIKYLLFEGRDISHIKNLLERLQKSEEKYKVLFDESMLGIILMDEKRFFLKVNKTGLNMLNIEDEKNIERIRLEDICPSEFIEDIKDIFKMLDEKGSSSFEWSFNTIDNKKIFADVTLNKLYINNKKHYQLSFKDITQKKIIEDEMEKARIDYQNINLELTFLMKNIKDIIFKKDKQGNYIYISPSCEKIIGYSSEYMLKNFNNIIIEKESIERQDKEVEKKSASTLYNIKIKDKESNLRVFEIKEFQFEENNAFAGYIGVARDITERAKIQETLMHNEKMISVGGLAAGMAHEINNPLSGIIQSVKNIKRRTDPKMNKNIEIAKDLGIDLETINEYFKKRKLDIFIDGIEDSALRAANIVKNMLDFSRKSEKEKKEVDIKEIIEKSITLATNDYDLKKKYDFRHIDIIKEIPIYDIKVKCVSSEIEQVLLNLLKNSAQALFYAKTNDPQIKIYLEKASDSIFIRLSDNGPGMPEKIRKRIFEPFFTTKSVGEGTGLGLSVSYFIIKDNHKGEIRVFSEKNKGTMFEIELPYEK